jgi:tyrosyl-tRNA synthetase
MGRELQKDAGQRPQIVMTLPLLEGTDGVRKMSKSYGNAIALNEPANDMFGKVMSLSDVMMWKFYELLTEEDLAGAKALHPMEAKKRLAGLLVERYHGAAAAPAARTHFESVFSQRAAPDDIPTHRAARSPIRLLELLVEAGLAPSKNEARRLIQQGAVEVAGERITEDREVVVHAPLLVKVGKRQFRKILSPE